MPLNNKDTARLGVLKEIFDALEEAFHALNIDYYLIGAQARETWYAKAGKTGPRTKDVDFAALIGSEKDYQAVRKYLKEHKRFQDTKGNAFVMYTPEGTQVDILPFGAIEINDGIELEGGALTSIKVNGFMEVYHGGTESLQLASGHSFKVATLPAIVLLKLIAFDDRPEKRMKDAADIADILTYYFELQADGIYDSHNDLFLGDEIDLTEISAIVIGREIRRMISANQTLYTRIQQILEQHIEDREHSPFVRGMIKRDSEATADSQVTLLQRLLQGLGKP